MTTINFEVEREHLLKAGQELTLKDGSKMYLPVEADTYYCIELEIVGNASPYTPAKLSGHPDTWTPPEGGEVEIEHILYRGETWRGKLTKEERDRAEHELREQAQLDADEARAEAMIEAYEDQYDYDEPW